MPSDVAMKPVPPVQSDVSPGVATPTTGTPEQKAVPFTRSATRKAAAAPALAYLNGDKVPIGDFLALLVGKNEFM